MLKVYTSKWRHKWGLDIGAYWSQRREFREDCANRTSRCLAEIQPRDARLRHWFRQSMSRKERMQPIELKPEAIGALMSVNKKDIGGAPIPELGFYFGAWNGDSQDTISLLVHCGCYAPRVGNNALLSFGWKDADSCVSPELLRELLDIFVEVWEPDRAVVFTGAELRNAPGKLPWEVKNLFAYKKP